MPVKVYLNLKINQLREVVIGDDGLSRKAKVKLFREQFLGTSANALSCVITNMDDIVLNYNKKSKTLTASCNTAIDIVNKNLGYRINYYLDNFVKSPKQTSFTGNFIFSEQMNPADEKRMLRNRENAYEGSRMQFIRALWSDNLGTTGFRLYNTMFEKLSADSVICLNTANEKEICLNERIIVAYTGYDYRRKLTYLSQTSPGAYIDKNGFYNSSLQWTGPMSAERVGDLLPYDYVPGSVKQEANDGINLHLPKSGKPAAGSPGLTAEAKLIRSIVLTPENPIDQRMVVKKWQSPVRYRIYGSFAKERDEMIADDIRRFCIRLSRVTGLDIKQAAGDSLANFVIVAGNPEKYRQFLSSEALSYAKNLRSSGFYYTASEEGITSVTQFIKLSDIPEDNQIWPTVQKLMLKGFGFFNNINGYKRSLFNDGISFLPKEIQVFDTQIIRALYNSSVRSGMSAQQFETTLMNGTEHTGSGGAY